jgi:UDP-glucose 4-epimerase
VTARSVLVTGATTPLGVSVCAALVRQGVAVLATGVEKAGRRLFEPKVDYVALDLARPRGLRDLIFGEVRTRAIDTVVHLAMHRRLELPNAHSLDVEALRQLLLLCEDHPTVRRVVVRSSADVYRAEHDLPSLVGEDHPLRYESAGLRWLSDRIEADAVVCSRMAMGTLPIVLLRCAELFAPDVGSQLYDYVSSKLCVRPLGFDPMINLLSLEDAAHAIVLAAGAPSARGVFNVPGADTLPLSRCIRLMRRLDVPLPGPMLAPLYRLRRVVSGTDFSYAMSGVRLHYPALLDGRAARDALGYAPKVSCFSPAAKPRG